MIDVGDEISRDGERFRLTGVSPNGEWIATPVEFGPNITLTARDLAAFGIEGSIPSIPRDETEGWKVLAQEAEAAREREPQEPPTPERIFEAVAVEEEEADAAERPAARREGIDGATAQRLGHRQG